MKYFSAFPIIVLLFCSLLIASAIYSESQKVENLNEQLEAKYEHNYEDIQHHIEQHLDHYLTPKERGMYLVSQLHFYMLDEQYEEVLNRRRATESYLLDRFLVDELREFYIIISKVLFAQGHTHEGYFVMNKAEMLLERVYEMNPSIETLEKVISINALKARTAQSIDFYDYAAYDAYKAEYYAAQFPHILSSGFVDNLFTYYFLNQEYHKSIPYGIMTLSLRTDQPMYQAIENTVLLRLSFSLIQENQLGMASELYDKAMQQSYAFNAIQKIDQYIVESEFARYLNLKEVQEQRLANARVLVDQFEYHKYKELIDNIMCEMSFDTCQPISKKTWSEVKEELALNEAMFEYKVNLSGQTMDYLYVRKYKLELLIMILIVSSSMIIAVYMLYQYIKIRKRNSLKNQVDFISNQLFDYVYYYKKISKNNDYIRHLNHDLRNHRIVILELMENKDYERVQTYLEQIETLLINSNHEIIVQNKTLNMILQTKVEICNDHQIMLETDVDVPEDIKLSEWLVIIIFSLILDYGIEINQNDKSNNSKHMKLSGLIESNRLEITLKVNRQSEGSMKSFKKKRELRQDIKFYGYSLEEKKVGEFNLISVSIPLSVEN